MNNIFCNFCKNHAAINLKLHDDLFENNKKHKSLIKKLLANEHSYCHSHYKKLVYIMEKCW